MLAAGGDDLAMDKRSRRACLLVACCLHCREANIKQAAREAVQANNYFWQAAVAPLNQIRHAEQAVLEQKVNKLARAYQSKRSGGRFPGPASARLLTKHTRQGDILLEERGQNTQDALQFVILCCLGVRLDRLMLVNSRKQPLANHFQL